MDELIYMPNEFKKKQNYTRIIDRIKKIIGKTNTFQHYIS